MGVCGPISPDWQLISICWRRGILPDCDRKSGSEAPALQIRLPSGLSRRLSGVSLGVPGFREDEKTRARSIGCRMDLPAGGGDSVCAAGCSQSAGARRGLLLRRLLHRSRASSPQTEAGSRAGIRPNGLRARYERHDVVLDGLLQRPVATGADPRRVCFACASEFTGSRRSVASGFAG